MTNKYEEVEVEIQFKGENGSTVFYVSLKDNTNLGFHSLSNIDDVKNNLKILLTDAIKEKGIFEVSILNYDDCDEEDDLPKEQTLVINGNSIVYFQL